MRFLNFLVSSFFLLSALSGAAHAAPSCDDLNTFWTEHGHGDFNVAGARTRFACPSTTASLARATRDLYLADERHGFYSAATRLVRSLSRRDQCVAGELARVSESARGHVELCPHFFSDDVSDEQRAGTLYHEAMHCRRDDPDHAVCRGGAERGRRICDVRFTDEVESAGANSLELLFYVWLRDSSDHTDVNRLMARNLVRSLFDNRFNEVTEAATKRYRR